MTTDKKYTLPLVPSQIVEFFKNKETIFEIDYTKTVQNGMAPKSILVYLSNLQVACVFDTIDEELLSEYIRIKDVCNIPNLNIAYANLVSLYARGTKLYDDNVPASVYESVIKSDCDTLRTVTELLNSTLVFAKSYSGISSDISDGIDNASDEKFEPTIPADCKRDDNLYDCVGFSFLKLYYIPDFLLLFLEDGPSSKDQTYFTKYFIEYMFKGSNLFSYFANEENVYFMILANLEAIVGQDQSKMVEASEVLSELNASIGTQID